LLQWFINIGDTGFKDNFKKSNQLVYL